jgi:LCP family protein required for cell wall assembly
LDEIDVMDFMDDAMSRYQPVRLQRKHQTAGIGCVGWLIGLLLVIIGVYFLAPFPTRMVLLGIDRASEGTAMGRSDTIVLTQFEPFSGRVKMLSIPRDLWIEIPGVGENRINAVHFFAEIAAPGSGPDAVRAVLRNQFGVDVPFYVRLQLEQFPAVVDALGGVTLQLEEPMSGYEAGTHVLNGEQALAFVHDRKGSDDFARMGRAQIFLKGLVRGMARPATWLHLPKALAIAGRVIDTNVPVWLWPRLGVTLLRAGPDGIESRSLTHEMAVPAVTAGGANVLLPQWPLILPLVQEMFGGR